MKKYTPSVSANNGLRDEAAAELKALLYKLEKGKYNSELDGAAVEAVTAALKSSLSSLENAIGTGEENVAVLADDVSKQIKELKKQIEQPLIHRVESAADELDYTVRLWKDVLDGSAVMESEAEIVKAKLSRGRKKLEARLSELDGMKLSLADNEKRIEEEISVLEKDLAQYDNCMIEEENERKINDLFRSIKTTKSKIDSLTVRRSNYSACRNLLDMIYVNAREILFSSGFAYDEIGKAKALLNMDRLRKVISDPDKAVVILKRTESDLKEIASKTKSLDEKVFGLDSGTATVSEDALKYKEELMRKKRDKERQNATDSELNSSVTENEKIKTEGD